MFRVITLASAALLSLSACTQPPAHIVNKSGDWFGKSAFADSRPSSYNRVGEVMRGPELERVEYNDTAQTGSVAQTDLTPLKVESKPLDAPIKSKPLVKRDDRPEPLHAPRSDNAQSGSTVVEARNDFNAPLIEKELPVLSSVRFQWPVEGGKLISRFGAKNKGIANDGINIAAPLGEPIWASADGVVVYSGNELKGYGNMVILRHNDGWMSAYAHAEDITVRKNEMVKQGDIIGYVGKSGGVDQAQLHFGIRKGKDPVDPERYLASHYADAQ